jgi:hypothetical protein
VTGRPVTWRPEAAQAIADRTVVAPPGETGVPSYAYRVRPSGPGHRAPTREARDPGTGEPRVGALTDDAPVRRTVVGIASTYGPGWDGWIAWPAGPGWRLRVCGPGDCVTVVTTDAGPDLAMQRAGRVVDLDVRTFERVAGAPWTIGLTKVILTVLGRVRPGRT